ncbi:RHS repeat-associated core domain-containing protein [Salinivibrio sp. ML290]|uniref:RHS repeat-associated core domain-containing protein n=1 Tax=Salinivibrio sp. ML290 TaxID=1909468 RepID=UPI00098863A2|nr:RHS repeat-associated core domain-containing protein [Salinivibrio sp. ML290]
MPNGTRYRYRYDPFGRRIAKECAHSDTQTHYLWDGAHIVQQQQATADGQVLQQTEYLYEPGSFRPMAQVTHHEQGSELHYIVTDHAGTPQELCNEQGDIVWRGEQALWGHYHGQSQRHWQRREEAANDSIQCDLRYQGQLEDPESSLYYNVNRYYDADSGQYLSPDPIGFAGGLRPQAYVANPLEWVDPLGLAGAAHGEKDKRSFEPNPKHGKTKRGNANPEPTNPQQALDDSIELPGNTTRRISVDKQTGEFSVFDEHMPGKFHGHTRTWKELDQTMQATLRKSGLVNKKGKIK